MEDSGQDDQLELLKNKRRLLVHQKMSLIEIPLREMRERCHSHGNTFGFTFKWSRCPTF